MSTQTFTIVTPALNHAHLIPHAIQSVSKSSHVRVEHLVVDRGSHDGTIRVAQGHATTSVLAVAGGLSKAAAVNAGIGRSTGEIIGWLAADDVYAETALERVAELFQQRPELDVVYGLAQLLDEDGEVRCLLDVPPWCPKRLERKCTIWESAVFFRRRVVERCGSLDEKLDYWFGYDYWLRLARASCRFARLPSVLAGLRMHRGNRTLGTQYAEHRNSAAKEVLQVVRSQLGRVPVRWANHFGREMAELDGHSRTISGAYDLAVLRHAFQALRQPGDKVPIRLATWMCIQHVAEEAAHTIKRPRRALRFMPWPRSNPLRSLFERKLFLLDNYAPRAMSTPPPYNPAVAVSPRPRVSIVTPNLNHDKYLERTLRSVLDQHYSNLDYVIQDGGSTDGSTDILRRYENRLSSWQSKPDRGFAHAINRGMQRTDGQIMAYLNSDDVLLPGSLDYVADYFSRNEDVDVVYGHRLVIDENDAEIGRWVLPVHDDQTIRWADYIPQETMFWRRRAWEVVGATLDESLDFAIDWDLILRFRSAGLHFVRLPRMLGAFRVTAEQKTSMLLETVGRTEMNRLRKREFGHVPSDREIRQHCRAYLRRHWVADQAYAIRYRAARVF